MPNKNAGFIILLTSIFTFFFFGEIRNLTTFTRLMDYNNGFSISSFFLSLLSFLWIGAQFPQEKFLSYGRILTLDFHFLIMCILMSYFSCTWISLQHLVNISFLPLGFSPTIYLLFFFELEISCFTHDETFVSDSWTLLLLILSLSFILLVKFPVLFIHYLSQDSISCDPPWTFTSYLDKEREKSMES